VTGGVAPDLLERVLDRLGLNGRPTTDRSGLDALYAAWCAHVPFDNTRKLVALRSGDDGPFPGIDPTDFFETWLEDGTGGTCWPSCNALYAVVTSWGFDAERVTASMMDMPEANHGTIIVRIDEDECLVDSSMLLNRVIRLTSGETVIDTDPLRPVEYETIDGEIRLWFECLTRSGAAYLPCRLLIRGVGERMFCEAYEASRRFGPFNHRLIATRNLPDRVETFQGRVQLTRRADGRRTQKTHDGDSLQEALVQVIGLSPAWVEVWAASGALAASLEEDAADGPPISGVPPSRRR
jgi:arylamine N-acetyltransferase